MRPHILGRLFRTQRAAAVATSQRGSEPLHGDLPDEDHHITDSIAHDSSRIIETSRFKVQLWRELPSTNLLSRKEGFLGSSRGLVGRTAIIGKEVYIHPTAEVHEEAILGNGVRLDAYVKVGKGAVIGEGSFLSAGADVFPGAHIGNGSKLGGDLEILPGAWIGERAVIGWGVKIGQGTHLGDDVRLGDYSQIGYGVQGQSRLKIGSFVKIGHETDLFDDSEILLNATIRDRLIIGTGVTIHANEVVVQSILSRSSAIIRPVSTPLPDDSTLVDLFIECNEDYLDMSA